MSFGYKLMMLYNKKKSTRDSSMTRDWTVPLRKKFQWHRKQTK